MRPDGPVKDLTEAQKTLADIAGVPANRPGLGAEYPKMVYRPGSNPRHNHLSEPIPIGNGAHDPVADRLKPGFFCETAYVDSIDDEAEALADGWFLSPFPEAQERHAKAMEAERAKDTRIAELEAELAAKRGPGRPPAQRD